MENARGVIPDEAECTHPNRLQVGISARDLESRTKYLRPHEVCHVELGVKYGMIWFGWDARRSGYYGNDGIADGEVQCSILR